MSEENATQTETQTAQNVETNATDSTSAADVTTEAPKKFKIKVNGQEREFDEKAVLAMASRSFGADEKFQKAAQSRKQLERLVQLAKDDPDSLLREVTGRDPEEIYKERLAKKLEQLSLDPKEKELRDYRRKLEEYEKKEQARQQAQNKEKADKATKFWMDKYDRQLPQAIKAAGLPLTPEVIGQTVDILIASLEDGIDLPYDVAMELVKDKYVGSMKKFLTSAQKEKLVDLLGQDVVDALIQVKQKKTQKQAPKVNVAQSQSQEERRQTKRQKQQVKDLDERIKRWASGE